MKHTLTLLFLFSCLLSTAQDFSEQWTGFFSYFNIKDISESQTRVYAAADNAILIYDVATNTSETISSVNGLSGEPITAILYSQEFETLVIGYENGLVEVLTGDFSDVRSNSGIIEEVSISPLDKRINHLMEFNGIVYVSTDFGIVEYSLENLEFGDTFRIGDNGEELQVQQTTVSNDVIYAATFGGGLRFADVTSENLINFEEWQGISTSNFDVVQAIGDNVYTVQSNRNVHRVENSQLVTIDRLASRATDFRANENQFILTTSQEVGVYDNTFTQIDLITEIEGIERDYVVATVLNNQIYIGHNTNGLLRINDGLPPTAEILSPDGPLLNRIFNMEAVDNELWVTFGEYNILYNPFPRSRRGISHLVGDEWRNIPFDSLMGALDIGEVTINPMNTDEVYFSSFGEGLLKVEGDTPTKFFTGANSNIFDFTPNAQDGSRINGTAFDSNGNLYVAQGFTDEIALYRIAPGSETLEPIDDLIDEIPPLGQGILAKIVIDRNDNLYIGTQVQGLVGYQPATGTVVQLRDDVGGAGFPDNDLRALEFDLNGRLWIGATTGLRILFNPQSIFTTDNVTVEPIIIEENGVAQELLFSQFVSSIEVDGSNNKWVGTAQNGVFLFSPDGQETLLRFTKENSPLPSNNITDIRIDEATSRVYIGTTNGLLAYNTTATSPEDNLESVRAYPNPVRPNYNGNVIVDGLTANANVKITDITGNLVHEDTSVGGTIEWDTTAFGRHRVASGVYLILITAEDAQETTVHKLMIVR